MFKGKVPYGDVNIDVTIPKKNLVLSVIPDLPPGLKDRQLIDEKVKDVLDHPISGRSFSEMLGPGKTVTIVVDNFARATPAYLILPQVLKQIEEAGSKPQIIVANGNLWQMNQEQLEEKIGKEILNSGIPIYQNDSKKREMYRFVGVTSYGTPVWGHKCFVEADVKIGIGLTQLNLWGYGGGGKIFLPGVCSYETIEWNHRFSVAKNSSIGVKREENRIRKDIEEAAKLAGLDMVINVILNINGEIIDIKAGPHTDVHDASVETYNDFYSYKLPLEGKVDIAISGSFVWDKLFAHSCWSIANLDLVTKDGGTIILASKNPSGLGHVKVMKKYMPPSQKGYEEALLDFYYRKAEFWDGVIWFKIYEVLMKKEALIVTEEKFIPEFSDLGLKAFSSMEEALAEAFAKHGENCRVGFLPFGKWSIPLK